MCIGHVRKGEFITIYHQKTNQRVPLVITYSKALPNIHDILRKNMKILHQ